MKPHDKGTPESTIRQAVICPHCGSKNPANNTQCFSCKFEFPKGIKLETVQSSETKICAKCGYENTGNAKQCANCLIDLHYAKVNYGKFRGIPEDTIRIGIESKRERGIPVPDDITITTIPSPPERKVGATSPPKRHPLVSAQPPEQAQQSVSAKFCSSCGKQVPEGSAFCLHCGSRIPTTITSSTSSNLATEWEYQDFIYNFAPPGQGLWAKLGSGAYSVAGAKLEFWQSSQYEITAELQKWLDEGWQPVGEVGSSSVEIRTSYSHRDKSAAYWLVFLVFSIPTFGLLFLIALFARSEIAEPMRFVLKMRRPK